MFMTNEKIKITKTFVDNVPLSPEKQVIYRDSELTGFGLRVKGVKTFIAEKKLPNGMPCRVTIGQYGLWTVNQAKDQAKEYLLMISKGINPNTEKKNIRLAAADQLLTSKSIPTIAEVYSLYKERKSLSRDSIIAYDICVNDYFEDWQNLKITELTQKACRDRFVVLTERSPAQANLAFKFLRALHNFAKINYLGPEDKPLITSENPAAFIGSKKNQNKIKRRRTYIRADQLHDWSYHVATTHWLGSQKDNMHAYTNQDYLFLTILTGFRRSEAETVEWKNIDLKYGTIKITDTKNGEDLLLPLGDMLWHILRERKKRAGDNQYVFPDRSGKSHIEDRRDVRKKITELSGIEFTFHDLRRTFGTIANSLAIGSYTIKRLINHTLEDDDNDVTDGYIQVSFEELRKAMNMIEEKVLSEEVKQLIKFRKYI